MVPGIGPAKWQLEPTICRRAATADGSDDEAPEWPRSNLDAKGLTTAPGSGNTLLGDITRANTDGRRVVEKGTPANFFVYYEIDDDDGRVQARAQP